MTTQPDLEPVLRFLAELSQNNQKAWFDQHRPDYESARGAFERLVNELIDEFRVSDGLQSLTARDCMPRINRDIRFSKDKSPYKTNLGAYIAPGGWKSVMAARSGYYLSIEPGGRSMVAGGLHMPTPEQLSYFRQEIDQDASEFKALTNSPDFVTAFGAVGGERLKTAPQGYDRSHPEIALLQLKQVTVTHNFTDPQVLALDFAAQAASLCRAMRPFLDYLDRLMP
jgi:uncharacterized protein (TIGR02453 family)